MTAFLRDVLDEAAALGLPWWQRAALVLALAVLYALARRFPQLAAAILRWVARGIGPPPPGTVSDGSAPGDPAGTPLPTDPSRPGGGESGGSG